MYVDGEDNDDAGEDVFWVWPEGDSVLLEDCVLPEVGCALPEGECDLLEDCVRLEGDCVLINWWVK